MRKSTCKFWRCHRSISLFALAVVCMGVSREARPSVEDSRLAIVSAKQSLRNAGRDVECFEFSIHEWSSSPEAVRFRVVAVVAQATKCESVPDLLIVKGKVAWTTNRQTWLPWQQELMHRSFEAMATGCSNLAGLQAHELESVVEEERDQFSVQIEAKRRTVQPGS